MTMTHEIITPSASTLLEAWNPGDEEPIHAVFVGGAAMPARVRLFVDFLLEHHRM